MFKSRKLNNYNKTIVHAFFNSQGGVSTGIYKGLNCGPGSKDKKINIKRNLNIDASTRSSAVLRIGLVFLAWSCFANRLIVYRTFQSPDWFLLGLRESYEATISSVSVRSHLFAINRFNLRSTCLQ